MRPPRPGTPSPKRPRVLLVKMGAIGDVVMAIPAAFALHQQGFAVDWVAGHTVAPVLAMYPWIHVIAVEESSLLRGSVGRRLSGMVALWRMLRRQTAQNGSYALIATLYYDRRYRLLSLPVAGRRRDGLSWTDRARELLPGRHHTDEYARILLNRADGELPYQLAPIPACPLPASPLRVPVNRRRVVLVPAGARNALRDDKLRRWPVEFYVTLAEALLEGGYEVVLVGGPEDRWASPYFAALARIEGERGQLIDALGAFTLLETVAVLNSAEVTVTHDTGPLHLAGITGTGLISIFGPTDPHGRLPQRGNAMAFWGGEGFACRPCYDGRDYPPCPHNGCMEQITPAMVLGEVEQMVTARAQSRVLPPRIVGPVSSGLVQIQAGAP